MLELLKKEGCCKNEIEVIHLRYRTERLRSQKYPIVKSFFLNPFYFRHLQR